MKKGVTCSFKKRVSLRKLLLKNDIIYERVVKMSVYDKLGVKKVVNASFALTKLGGSRLADEIQEAMEEANKNFCWIWELEERAGKIISEITGAEAGFVTSGAFNALVLSAAACIAGKDPEKMRQLPDATGMKNEIIIQRTNRIPIYDRSMEVPGGKLIVVGDETGCTLKQIEGAITDKTAAVHYLAPMGFQRRGVVPLEDVLKVAHKHGVPVIVDAAGQTWPLDGLHKFTDMGCDLVCYGGKYVGGPNSSGFVIGKKELVEAVALHSFIGAESGPLDQSGYYMSVGRGYKLDRQEIVAVVVALQRWVKLDHEKVRFKPAWDKVHYIEDGIKGLNGLKDVSFGYVPPEGRGCGYHVIGLQLNFRSEAAARSLVKSLRGGNPEIWVRGGMGPSFAINTLNLADGEEKMIVDRFKKLMG